MATPTLHPYQQRVVEEKQSLDIQKKALKVFIDENERFGQLPEAEQLRMQRQFSAMQEYSDVLGERIEAFTP